MKALFAYTLWDLRHAIEARIPAAWLFLPIIGTVLLFCIGRRD